MSLPPIRPIKKLLIANRGEIATRILSTARELDIETYTLYTTNDVSHTLKSNHQIELPSPASYLDITALVSLAKKHNIDAVHPGYGFLSESAEFSQWMWSEANAIVIGPGPTTLAQTGDKLQARLLAEKCQVPVLPALQTPTDSIEELGKFAGSNGFPIIIKAVDGGGGRGIRVVRKQTELEAMAKRALQESPSKKVFAEKAAVDGFRHIEVQIVGDGKGNVRHLWERECSIQRRFQKIVEFAPSAVGDRALISRVIEAALRMAQHVKYLSLGTFEFLVRESPPAFFFLEVNPRIQVEHTITESICGGIDLVRTQLLLAQGFPLSDLDISKLHNNPSSPPPLCSIQLRVTAEDPFSDWSLSIGKVRSFQFPSGNGIRVDTSMVDSPPTVVGTDFDSLLSKIIVTSTNWHDTVCKARRALQDTNIEGIKTNLPALRAIIDHPDFIQQKCDTQWLESNILTIFSRAKTLSNAVDSSSASLINSASSEGAIVAAGASAGTVFRKGDAWSLALSPISSTTQIISEATAASTHPAHIQINRVLRNEFPTSLSAEIAYTDPSGTTVPYRLDAKSTNASSTSISSSGKFRQGNKNNPNHIIIPFPGQLMEICVDEGDVVSKGETIAIVRQMKMELEVRMKKAGRVAWVFEGDEGVDVGEGTLVAELEDGEGMGKAKL